jgi:hypothetical protein
MTLLDIQKRISARYDISGDTVPTTSTEWGRRVTLINLAEKKLQKESKWSWLIKTTTLTTTPNVAHVNLPADYSKGSLIAQLTTHLKIDTVEYMLADKATQTTLNSTSKIVWISGNEASGYRLNIQPTPTTAVSFSISYISTYMATDSSLTEKEGLADATDITKVPNPDYLTNYVLAELYASNDDLAKARMYTDMMQEELRAMLINDNYEMNTLSPMVSVTDYDFEPLGGNDRD